MDLLRTNKELSQFEIDSDKLILESMPQILMLVPTTRCNLRCIMCDRVLRDFTLPPEAVRKISPLLPHLKRIDIQGGEPMLMDYFEELFSELISNRQTTVSLLTNGLLINDRWRDLLVRDNVHLSFSIDSCVKDTYEYIRKGARFEKLLKSIDLINESAERRNARNPLNKINAVVMRCNYKELSLFPKFCKRYGFSGLTFDYLRPEVAPGEDIFVRAYDPAAAGFLRQVLPEIESECNELGIEFSSQALSPFLDRQEEPSPVAGVLQGKICELPWKKLFIDSDGSIYPDCLCDRPIGNLNGIETLSQAWNNKKMQAYRRNIINGRTNNWCSETCLMNAVEDGYRKGL